MTWNTNIAWDTVADLYDTYVQATFDIPFFVREALAKGRKRPGEVLELMAGTGRISLPLAEAGVHLTCVDASAAMLERLQCKLEGRSLTARLERQDVRELSLGQKYDLILLPFHSLSEITDPQERQQALERIHAHLKSGGRFICTLHNPAVRLKSATGQLQLVGQHPLPDGAGTLLFWMHQRYDPGKRLLSILEIFEIYDASGMQQSRRLLELSAALIEREEFESAAEAAGFHPTALYGDYEYAPFDETASPFMIWVLAKTTS